MHSEIKRKFQNIEVELPSDYTQIMKTALSFKSNGGAYIVNELCSEDFKDFAELNNQIMMSNAFRGKRRQSRSTSAHV